MDALASIARILIVHSDRLYSDLLRRSIQAFVATAKVFVACTIADASAALAQQSVDLLVTSVLAADGEVLSALPDWVERRHAVHRTLVVTPLKEPWVLEQLAASPIRGVCDAEAGADEFQRSVTKAATGAEYWSPSMREALARARARLADLNLSPTERVVFAVIAPGADDITAAEMLGMTPAAVKSVRKRLYRKLAVQHKGELVDRAIEFGFVIMHRGLLVRPGCTTSVAARRPRGQGSAGDHDASRDRRR